MFGGLLSAVSNRADWVDCVEVTDDESGLPFDLTTVQDIVMAVLYPAPGVGLGGNWYDPGNYYGVQARLSDGSIQLVQPGVFQFAFSAGQMSGLAPQTYNVGLVIRASDGVVYQLIIAQVPVLEGYAVGVSNT